MSLKHFKLNSTVHKTNKTALGRPVLITDGRGGGGVNRLYDALTSSFAAVYTVLSC